MVKGALGKDAGRHARRSQAHRHRLAVNTVEAVCGQKVLQVEIGRARKGFAGFAECFDVIYRKRNGVMALVIEADHFQGRTIGIEVDGVRIEVALFDLAAVERVVAEADSAAGDGGIRQLVNRFSVRGVVFGRNCC